jgi:CRISPR-associated endonuclease Cas1
LIIRPVTCSEQATSPEHQGGFGSMAATKTVAQHAVLRNSSSAQLFQVPRHGVVTLYGYGIQVRVDRGHLVLEDGIGVGRRYARLPRVGHGLRRLVVIGTDGYVSLAALRWLADQDAAFVMLERNGSVLATTGPVRSSDARLRRAQALAFQSGAALQIVRELIDKKIGGQSQVARDKLKDSAVAKAIEEHRKLVATAANFHELHTLESSAAVAYWSGWDTVSVTFPKSDLPRVPEHSKSFRARRSPLSGSQRVACDPVNAMLNYCYSLLEAEARLAVAALGLDPGLGFLHFDAPARDSLASDIMEPVRPEVDAFVLDWITTTPLKRKWFFERPDGNCHLMASLAEQLSETVPMCRVAVAPFAERVARILWQTARPSPKTVAPPTRLTQRHKREAKGARSLPVERKPRPQNICQGCGSHISPRKTYCYSCGVATSTKRLLDVARQGRIIAVSPDVNARRAEKTREHNLGCGGWTISSQPPWLTNEFYETKIQPLLCNITRSAISTALGVSKTYAGEIRTGRSLPHPRHWLKLAKVIGISLEGAC